MGERRQYRDQAYLHFVTFSCFRRRRILDRNEPKRVVLGILNGELKQFAAKCAGFVLMPDHVHALIWLPREARLSDFLRNWKRKSSHGIKQFLISRPLQYAKWIKKSDPIWQRNTSALKSTIGARPRKSLNTFT